MLLSEAVRDLARDRNRSRSAVLAVLVLVALVALLVSSSSPSSSSSASAPAPPARSLCATKTKTTNMGLLGGPSASANPAESLRAAEFAVEQLQTNSAFPKQGAVSLARLVSAQTQVVAGTNHILVLETKDDSGKIKTVHATVWEKLPDRERNGARDLELTKFSVADGGGAPVAEGVECGDADEQWQGAAARAAVDAINARSNSLVPYELAAVLEAKRADASPSSAELKLRLKRGDKSETFRVSVEEKGAVGAAGNGGASSPSFGLVSFAQEP